MSAEDAVKFEGLLRNQWECEVELAAALQLVTEETYLQIGDRRKIKLDLQTAFRIRQETERNIRKLEYAAAEKGIRLGD